LQNLKDGKDKMREKFMEENSEFRVENGHFSDNKKYGLLVIASRVSSFKLPCLKTKPGSSEASSSSASQ
jgi:hypothetical protein